MTPEELQKVQELRSLHYQAYEINRKIEMLMASLMPKKKAAKKFNPDQFQKEIDRIANRNPRAPRCSQPKKNPMGTA